ncbi:MAG: DUF951 domain-containing protein [Bacilli bacterium]|jgi:hypothetical protein|nr:DUF951 domain-containing protein [Bacilli bacterium]
MASNYKLGDTVIMKKPHACGTNEWQIVRTGVDIKIKCIKCNREIMMDRLEFEKKLKKIVGGTNE